MKFKLNLKIDYWLLAPVVILMLMSLTTLASIDTSYFRNQLISFALSILVFLFLTRINHKSLQSLKAPIYIFSLIILLIILIIGIESRGAMRWLDIFGVRLQFSEILKPALSIAFASYIAGIKKYTFEKFIRLNLFVLPVFFLIYAQPDLGSALLYIGVFYTTLLIVGFPLRWFLFALIPFLASSPLIWTMLHDYQRQRILTFLDPQNDPLGTSYNSIQAIIAVGSGSFFGKGLGEGTQSGLRFLPEKHTDFIFATMTEGLGFIGGLIIIMAFTILLIRIYQIFLRSDSIYEKTFLICAFLFIYFQFLFNMGMNIGLLPIVGITLPFVSYGGSSLLTSFIFLGITSSISISQKTKHVLEIR